MNIENVLLKIIETGRYLETGHIYRIWPAYLEGAMGENNPNKYLIHFNGIGKFIELSTKDTTSKQFIKIQRDFVQECTHDNIKFRGSYADMIRLYPEQEIAGVYYTWGLSGSGGACFNFNARQASIMDF